MNDACIHGPGVAQCGHPDCVEDREFGRPIRCDACGHYRDRPNYSCHCGRPVHVYDDLGGFTRNMCWECSTVRCDVDGRCPSTPDGPCKEQDQGFTIREFE